MTSGGRGADDEDDEDEENAFGEVDRKEVSENAAAGFALIVVAAAAAPTTGQRLFVVSDDDDDDDRPLIGFSSEMKGFKDDIKCRCEESNFGPGRSLVARLLLPTR